VVPGYVPEDDGSFAESGAMLDPDILGDGYMDVVNIKYVNKFL